MNNRSKPLHILCARKVYLLAAIALPLPHPSHPAPKPLPQMLEQGFNPDSRDYDHRSALMLAAAKGHMEAVQLLLAAGANPSAVDSLGGCPLLEACKAGADDVVALLMGNGARLSMTGVMT